MPGPLSVLVVDSYPDAAESTAVVLRLNGFAARVTLGSGEALAAVRDWTPDVVLLDIPLRDGDGYQLLAELRTVLPHPPLVVVLTGLDGCEHKSRLAGCDHHLTKPIDPRHLIDLLGGYAQSRPVEVG